MLPQPCSTWHQSPRAHTLLANLATTDIRLAQVHNGPDPAGLTWHPASPFGAATLTELSRLRETAIGPAFASALNDQARTAALTAAQSAPTVAAAVASRFGNPDRWRGYDPLDATRRFRANGR